MHRELNRAAQIIKLDHFQRLEKGQGIRGALKPSKKKIGKTLVESGKMRNLVIDKATKQTQEANVHPGQKQSYPGKTRKAEKNIIKMVEDQIERQIRRA